MSNILQKLKNDPEWGLAEPFRSQRIYCRPYIFHGKWGIVIKIQKDDMFFPRKLYFQMLDEGIIMKINVSKEASHYDYKLWIMHKFKIMLEDLGFLFNMKDKIYSPNDKYF